MFVVVRHRVRCGGALTREIMYSAELGIRIGEFSHFDAALVEMVEQARIDSHLAEVFAKRLPVRAAAADWAVVNADHAIAPDIGGRLARNADLFGREIGDAPCQPATQRAVTIRDPCGHGWQRDPHVAAVAASMNGHGGMLLPIARVCNVAACALQHGPRT